MHKISTKLAKNFDAIAIEDLKTKNITKRAKLKNIEQKSELHRSIYNFVAVQNQGFTFHKSSTTIHKQNLK